MKTKILTIALILTGVTATAQSNSRDQFVKQQAYNEMMRVVRQMEVLESNFSSLSDRVSRLERGGETSALKSEIEALKAEIARLKAEMKTAIETQEFEKAAELRDRIRALEGGN